jgi:predicted nucleic acid-binding protein
MAGYVIDASVLVEVFVAGRESQACMTFLEHAARTGAELCAPDAIYYEIAGALRRAEIRIGYRTIGEDVASLSDLDLITTPARELLLTAVNISRQHEIGIYDSFYLALSNQLGFPVITVDERLARAAENKPFDVVIARNFVR